MNVVNRKRPSATVTLRPDVVAVLVATGGVRLPDLHERVAERLALGVAHPAGHDDPLTDRSARMLGCEVVVLRCADPLVTELRPSDLGERVRQIDERLLGMPQRR